MDEIAQWRPGQPQGPEGQTEQNQRPPVEHVERWRNFLLGGVGVVALGAAGVALWATTPQPQIVLQPLGQSGGRVVGASASAAPVASFEEAERQLVVDVQGAVERPGLHVLDDGSRVGDAIVAAGGYSTQVDIAAAAQSLNLAQPVVDGAKIHVPARGDQPPPGLSQVPTTPPSGSSGASGLIDVNTATSTELDTLPGIGPVTAGKIIAAREEIPFASVDELLERKIVGPATFDKIRELVTVGP
ncbi:MAG TPA: ComEA family DNA-binding protein [Candidatus Caenarcaniphilales bacterium]|nr:ComEA family DNA-binding protein [Candidatus Caenarcaniphilales bacterium]